MIILPWRNYPLINLTPKQIVEELDRYIIGQKEAKRSVAIAVRNRWRRQQLSGDLKNEVAPKNIIMIGPTGVGKTEIARRLAHLVKAPFLKVEATKYTEVGYHGRDVESMIRDLVEIGVNMVKQEQTQKVQEAASAEAEEKLLDLLLPLPPIPQGSGSETDNEQYEEEKKRRAKSRDRMRHKLRAGELEDSTVEIHVEEKSGPVMEIFTSGNNPEQMGMDIQNIFEKMVPGRNQLKKMTVKQARTILIQQQSEKLIDREKVSTEALARVENTGMVFIDEIDKIAGNNAGKNPDVSRAGVQRDLLPIVEGSTVVTRYGVVKTDHILFIAAGAFSFSKPSDLIPELQGRFPIRVELQSLSQQDLLKILTEPRNALLKQYTALLNTENISISFSDDAISEIAKICEKVNKNTQNIGARRLHTIMETLLEEISFSAPDLKTKQVVIDKQIVCERLDKIVQDEDLSRYIL